MQVSSIHPQSRFVLGLSVTAALVSQIKVTWEDLSGVEHSQTVIVKLSDTFTVCLWEKSGKKLMSVVLT